MISIIPATPRTRRAYDHRLREHVVRSGATSLGHRLAIPRSMISTRERRGLRSVVTLEHLDHDPPEPRAVHPPGSGEIVEIPEVGGLHHRYIRQAASPSSLRILLFEVKVEICPERESADRSASTECACPALPVMAAIYSTRKNGFPAAGERPGEGQPLEARFR